MAIQAIPKLLMGSPSGKDKEALLELADANIPFDFCMVFPDRPTPILVYQFREWHGLDGIRRFIKTQKVEVSNHQPD